MSSHATCSLMSCTMLCCTSNLSTVLKLGWNGCDKGDFSKVIFRQGITWQNKSAVWVQNLFYFTKIFQKPQETFIERAVQCLMTTSHYSIRCIHLFDNWCRAGMIMVSSFLFAKADIRCWGWVGAFSKHCRSSSDVESSWTSCTTQESDMAQHDKVFSLKRLCSI